MSEKFEGNARLVFISLTFFHGWIYDGIVWIMTAAEYNGLVPVVLRSGDGNV
ncbi:MAG: hypothetical protein K8R11_11770 [Methanococcoides sp.]|nr:hypothetical protein [Methanococcoides sp.]